MILRLLSKNWLLLSTRLFYITASFHSQYFGPWRKYISAKRVPERNTVTYDVSEDNCPKPINIHVL